jgi:MFS family permease
MALLELTIQEAKSGDLPPVCMRCGKPAAGYQHAMLYWRPWWVAVLFYPSLIVYLLPYIILDSLFGRRVALRAPVCEAHRYHWRWRLFVLFGVFAASLLSIVVGLAVAIDLLERVKESRQTRELRYGLELLGGMLILIGYAGLFAVALATPILRRTAIYAKSISKNRITLSGVAPAFIEAKQSTPDLAATESVSHWRDRAENIIAAETKRPVSGNQAPSAIRQRREFD